MRKRLTAAALVLCMLLTIAPVNVWAADYPTSGTCGENVTWTYDAGTKTLKISGTGPMEVGNPWSHYSQDIELVEIEDGVTTVASYAFKNCSNLKRIVIPASVISIDCALTDCVNLMEFSVDGKNPILSSKEGVLFGKVDDDKIALMRCPAKKSVCTIPENVVSIEENAFYSCSSLTHISIPNGVTSIKGEAFYGCNSLVNIVIPNSINAIEFRAFYGCSSLKDISIPDSVTSIGSYAFCGCSSLKGVSLSNIRQISTGMFNGCTQLSSVFIPAKIRGIADAAFANCPLENVYWGGSEDEWKALNIRVIDNPELSKATIHYNATGLPTPGTYPTSGKCGDDAEWSYDSATKTLTITKTTTEEYGTLRAPSPSWEPYKSEVTTIVIGDGIQSVASAPPAAVDFSDFTSLSNVSLPKTLTSIPPNMFKNCTALSSIFLPEGISGIGESAFEGCTALEEVAVPSRINRISNAAFKNCTSLSAVRLPVHHDSSTHDFTSYSISESCFEGCSKLTINFAGTEREWELLKGPAVVQRVKDTTEPSYTPVVNYNTPGLPGNTWGDSTNGGTWSVHHGILTVHGTGKIDYDEDNLPPWAVYFDDDSKYDGVNLILIDKGITEVSSNTEEIWNVKVSEPGKGGVILHFLGEKETLSVNDDYYEIHCVEALPEVPATCDALGKTASIVCKHPSHTGPDPYYTIDGGWTIPATGHTAVEIPAVPATCLPGKTAGKRCSTCGNVLEEPTEIPAIADHTLSETGTDAEVKKPATCTEKGLKVVNYECTVCHTLIPKDEEIPANGHKPETIVGKAPTCTDDGLTDGSKCTVCQEIITEQKPISALGHDWVAGDNGTETITKTPTCTTAGEKTITGGSKCSRCTEVDPADKTIVLPSLGHDWSEETSAVTKAATCAEEGITTFTKSCKRTGCDGIETRTEPIEKRPHTWGEWTTTKEATATEAGERKHVCSVCKAEETEVIPATGTPTDPDAPDTPKGPYTITLDPNGGILALDKALTTGTDGTLSAMPKDPTRSGYTFLGWFTAASGGTEVTTATTFTADATIYAHWERESTTPASGYYNIDYPDRVTGGTFEVSHDRAKEGTRITIELSPRSNYELNELEVVNADTGRVVRLTERYADEYTFSMPDSDVEIYLSYQRRDSGGGGYYVPAEPVIPMTGWYYQNGRIYTAAGEIVPDRTLLTRDMLLSILYNREGGGAEGHQVWATKNSIVPDYYEGNYYGTDKPLTREQTAMILYCYARYRSYNTAQRGGLTGYSDYGQIRPMAHTAMSWARGAGLMTGTTPTTLSPTANLTCGQACVLLSRFAANVSYGW